VIRAATSSVDETRALAHGVAQLLRPGDLLLLAGDLGAGKTAFTQGLGAGLEVEGRVTSPTFTLHNRYQGRHRLDHLDVYRLDQLEEVLDLGLPELLDEGGVIVIEWGDRISPALPAEYLEVRLALGDGDDDRLIELHLVGSVWSARREPLEAVAEPFAPAGAGGEAPC
jgi:tRNA threonylcarbamoyladenosine biosynthesis protein TsaE